MWLPWCREIFKEYQKALGKVKNWRSPAWKTGLAHCALIHKTAEELLDTWERCAARADFLLPVLIFMNNTREKYTKIMMILCLRWHKCAERVVLRVVDNAVNLWNTVQRC